MAFEEIPDDEKLSFENGSSGQTTPPDPWYTLDSADIIEVSSEHVSDGNVAMNVGSYRDDLSPTRVGVDIVLDKVETVVIDAYVEASNLYWGSLRLQLADNKLVRLDNNSEDQWYYDQNGDVSDVTGQHTLVLRAVGDGNDAFFDNIRFLDSNGDRLPVDEVVVDLNTVAIIAQSSGTLTPSETVTLDASTSTGTIDSFDWDFGDGTTASGEIVTHSYESPGEYTVELTVSSSDGTDTATADIVVEAAAVAASFDYSPQFAATSTDITFDASPSSGDIDEFTWQFGDGTEKNGVEVTHSYDTTGEYTVQLRVQATIDGTEIEETTTATVQVETEDGETVTGFTIDDTEPQTYDTVRFDTGVSQDTVDAENLTLTWEFGDGTTAEGTTVSHQYETAGTYTITLTADGDTFSRDLTVGTPPVEITNVERDIGGTLLPQLGIEEGVEATVDVLDNKDLDRVEFDFAGQQVTTTSQPYDVSLTIDEVIAPATPLTVRAITTDGTKREIEREIPIQRLPEWLEYLLEVADTLGVERTDKGIEITYSPLSNLDVGFEIPSEVLSGDDNPHEGDSGDYDFGVDMGGVYDPLTNEAELTAAGNIAAEVMALAFEIKVALIGTIEATTLNLESAQADIESKLSFDIEPPTVPIPVSIPIPGTDSAIGIVPTVIVSADGTFNFNGDFSFDTGAVQPGIELEVSIGIDLEIPGLPDGELVGVPSGGIDGSFDVGTDNWNLSATFFLSGKVVLDPPVVPGITLEQDPIWDQTLTEPSGESTQLTASPSSTARVRQTSTGGQRPLPEIDSVDTVSADTQSISPRETFRLTDRSYEDVQPVLASLTDSKQLVVWGQQDENKSADAGHDLVARWYENGSWGDQFTITDSVYADADPVCAATESGEILLAWKRLPEDQTTSDDIETLAEVNEIRNKTEIAYSIYDGDTWSSPTLLTSTSITQRRPTVATEDGSWHLAWESFDRKAGTSTVRSTIVSPDGSTTAITDRSGTASPDLGARDDGNVDLAYLVMDSGQVTDITHEIRDGTSITSEQAYSAPEAATVVVANGRVVWSTNLERNPTLVEGTDGTTTDLSLREDVIEVRELSLSARTDQAILSYVSILEGGSTRDLVYRLDQGNGWIFDRRITEDIQDGLRVRYTDLVFTGSASFLSGYSVRDPGTDTVSDVFATLQEFGPAYALDGSVNSGVAGEETTLSYELENRGDVDGTEQVTVTILRDGTEIDSVTHDPLNSGESLTRDRTFTIGNGGEFEIKVDVPEPSLETEPRQVSLIAAHPQLRVDSIAAERNGVNEAAVSVTVVNDGGAAAENIPVALVDAAGTVTTPTVDQIGAQTTTTVETTVDPQALDNSETHKVQIDPEGTLPPQAETTPLRQTYLVRPNLQIKDIKYREDDERFVRVLVSNTGPGRGSGTLTIRDGADNELQMTEISVPPAQSEDGQVVSVHQTVDILTPTLAQGQSLTIEVNTEVSDLNQEGLATAESVETILSGEYQGTTGDMTVTATGGTLSPGGNVNIDTSAENITQMSVTKLWTDWTLDADVPSEHIDNTVGTNGTLTLSWETTQSSVAPTVSVSVPDRYVGGEYLVTVTASNGSETTETTATLTIE
jgi:PKD repeat protein